MKGIILTGKSVQDTIDGIKGETRRLVKLPIGNWWNTCPEMAKKYLPKILNHKYGKAGSLLFVKESYRPVVESFQSFIEYEAGGSLNVLNLSMFDRFEKIDFRCGPLSELGMSKKLSMWHNPMFMPEQCSRVIIELVKDPTVEQLLDIDRDGAIREGYLGDLTRDPVEHYLQAWDGIQLKRPPKKREMSQTNPFVWVILYKVKEIRQDLGKEQSR